MLKSKVMDHLILQSSHPDGIPKENNSEENPDSVSLYIGQKSVSLSELPPELHTHSKIVTKTVLNVTKTPVTIVSMD